MNVRRSVLRSFLSVSLLCSLPSASQAQEDRRQQCIQAYESGQRLKKAGDLVEAQSRLAFCANPICPPLMREDCTARLSEVKADTPSVLLSVKFNAESVPVRVSIDGQARAWAEDAPRLVLNPGRHELRVEADGFASQTVPLLLGEGERAAPIVTFEAVTEPPPPPPTQVAAAPVAEVDAASGFPTAALVLAASSVVGASGFVYFGLTARSHEQRLVDGCAPACSSAQVGEVKRDYLLANVGLGLGVASLLGEGILLWMHSQHTAPSKPSATRIGLQLSPARFGVIGRF